MCNTCLTCRVQCSIVQKDQASVLNRTVKTPFSIFLPTEMLVAGS